ncbi:MAG: sugar ABC transporter permease [Epulopiscium sp. Nele67-Bin001]|nr:MAG: sugar ABC transporter permease [Epulopiscium sp. Nuni2H_MBin001]OON91888.1 MAG: sugar ABC transporter permease [Epulopiscium sp. Nele67-Bin001]
MKTGKGKKVFWSVLTHIELLIMSCIVIVPICWIVMSSFNASSGLASSSLIPQTLTLDNYRNLFTQTNYSEWFMNTLQIAIVNSIFSVSIIMLSSWIFSRFNFRGKKFGLMSILLLSMFPSFLSMTAIYILFMTFGLLNKPIALVLIYSIGAIPYNTWLVKGYLDGVPKTLDEAAYIDGCTRFQTFFKITLPLSMPIITYVAVTQFMTPWMDYILPNLLLSQDEHRTLAVGLNALISGKENTNFTMFAAGAVLIAVPISILFMVFQKYLVQGIAAGANKE